MSDVIFVYASFNRLAAVGGDVFSLDVPDAVADDPPFVVVLPVFVPLLFKLFAVVLPVRCMVIFFRIFAKLYRITREKSDVLLCSFSAFK